MATKRKPKPRIGDHTDSGGECEYCGTHSGLACSPDCPIFGKQTIDELSHHSLLPTSALPRKARVWLLHLFSEPAGDGFDAETPSVGGPYKLHGRKGPFTRDTWLHCLLIASATRDGSVGPYWVSLDGNDWQPLAYLPYGWKGGIR